MSPLFLDTSALYALFDADDRFHRAAAAVFAGLSPDETAITGQITS